MDLEKVLTGIARIQFESHFLTNHSNLNRNGIAFVSRPADNQSEFNIIWEADQGIYKSVDFKVTTKITSMNHL